MKSLTMLATTFVWLANPVNDDWNNPANWTPVGNPGPDSAAMFSRSTRRDINVTGFTEVNALAFSDGLFRFRLAPETIFRLHGSVSAAVMPEFVLSGGLNQNGAKFFIQPKASLSHVMFVVKGRPMGNAGQLFVYGQVQDSRLYANAGSNIIVDADAVISNTTILSKPGIQGMLGGQIYVRGASSIAGARIILSGASSYLQAQDHAGPIALAHLSGKGVVWLGTNEITISDMNFCGRFDGGTVKFGGRTVVKIPNSMLINGSTILGGVLEVQLPDGIGVGVYPLIEIDGARFGHFSSIRVVGLPPSMNYSVEFAGNALTLRLSP